jgi:hypothetical protein
MNLLDAIRLYCHIMQQSGGDLAGRKAAFDALENHRLSKDVIEAIAVAVSNDGNLTSGEGGRFAITQISAS